MAMREKCTWSWDYWENIYETSCDTFFELADGTLEDNYMRFCPFCGRPIDEILKVNEEDEDAL